MVAGDGCVRDGQSRPHQGPRGPKAQGIHVRNTKHHLRPPASSDDGCTPPPSGKQSLPGGHRVRTKRCVALTAEALSIFRTRGVLWCNRRHIRGPMGILTLMPMAVDRFHSENVRISCSNSDEVTRWSVFVGTDDDGLCWIRRGRAIARVSGSIDAETDALEGGNRGSAIPFVINQGAKMC